MTRRSGWQPITLANLLILSALQLADASTGFVRVAPGVVSDVVATGGRTVAVASYGRIVLNDVAEPEGASRLNGPLLTAISASAHSPNMLWAVGHDGQILHSADGGEGWVPQHARISADEPVTYLDVLSLRDHRVIAVGAYSALAVSDDDGRTWRFGQVSEDDGTHINAITPISDRVLFAAGEGGNNYWSFDRGDSWSRDDAFPYDGSMFAAVRLEQGVLVAGLLGHVYLRSLPPEPIKAPADDFAAASDWDRVGDDSAWVPIDKASDATLFGAHALSQGQYLLVGARDTRLLFNPETRRLQPLPSAVPGATWRAAANVDRQVWLAGDRGLYRYQHAGSSDN